MDRALLQEGLAQLHLPVDEKVLDRFAWFTSYLIEENTKLNLTAITDPHDIVVKHYLDSASVLTVEAARTHGARVIDVGCGAGFPSVVLKLLRDDLRLTMLDATRKRVDFLERVGTQLGFTDVQYLHARAEEAARQEGLRAAFDLCVTRAVARLPVLLEYCLPFVKTGGMLIAMKGPEAAEELREAQHALRELRGEPTEVREIQLPFSDITHHLICIKKISANLPKYPRNAGKIRKSPL